MAEIAPEIGLVIRHAYLWWNEARAGREEGVKDRPCVIIHKRQNEYGETEVFIAPVTHTPASNPERVMEIPTATKKRLRLDAARSWVITTELNRFVWPGPDVRPTPAGHAAYGLLPANMTRELVRRVGRNARDKSIAVVQRSP